MAKKKNAVRDDGRIAVQVYIGRDENGKRKYKTVYGTTQGEADEKAMKLKLAMNKGLNIASERDTFKDWSDIWISIKETEVGKSQANVYRCALKHLNAAIGEYPLTKIKPVDIKFILTALSVKNPNTKKPASKATLSMIKITAGQVFRMAIENRVTEYNPADYVKVPVTAQKGKRRALDAEEQQWILDTTHNAKRAAMIMMYSGLRRGELIPLTWNDIDLDAQTIAVNKAVEKVTGRFEVKFTAKTEAGLRTVDIPKRLADYLREEKRESIYVCANTQGLIHTESSWRRMWESYLADLNLKYGDFSAHEIMQKDGTLREFKSKFDPKGVPFVIPKITPHWLRHTFATMLYFSGVDILTAKEQLGHADVKTTLEIYTHLDAIYKRKTMKKLDDFLDSASQDASQKISKT